MQPIGSGPLQGMMDPDAILGLGEDDKDVGPEWNDGNWNAAPANEKLTDADFFNRFEDDFDESDMQ